MGADGGARANAQKAALRVFAVLPNIVRRHVVRAISPHYVLGAVCVIRHGDDVLMLRQRHDNGEDWALPGGLLQRGELPREGLAREVEEEIGLQLDLPQEPTHVIVIPGLRRVDLAYVVDVAERPTISPDGVEVLRAQWRPLDSVALLTPAGQVVARVRASDGPASQAPA
jgi:8-oxo-dGTP pyrophosphatase MutT (NUDIX family)